MAVVPVVDSTLTAEVQNRNGDLGVFVGIETRKGRGRKRRAMRLRRGKWIVNSSQEIHRMEDFFIYSDSTLQRDCGVETQLRFFCVFVVQEFVRGKKTFLGT